VYGKPGSSVEREEMGRKDTRIRSDLLDRVDAGQQLVDRVYKVP